MEDSENILEAILELENQEDVLMLDVDEEEGEYIPPNSSIDFSQGDTYNTGVENGKSPKEIHKCKKKKKNKKKKTRSPAVKSINRFVTNTCRHLKERKSYLVWTAVGCLGISALNDLIREVDAIQACGGQITTDGSRNRTGGGILWNILKLRDPKAYKEIMQRGREFEKQFRGQNEEMHKKGRYNNSIYGDGEEEKKQNEKKENVHSRLRVPVSYDDPLLH